MSEISNAAFWQMICQSAESHAAQAAANCRREYSALIRKESKRFCEQGAPQTNSELTQRHTQALYLTSKISAIAHADLMARSNPSVAAEILEATRNFVEGLGLNDSPFAESIQLTSAISLLGHSAMMQRA